MTRYSRSVIPGRQAGDNASDMDRMIFGQKPAANDSDEGADISEGEVSQLVERAVTDRRKGKNRRQSDFAPLPEAGYKPPSEGSKRGPLLLVGAMVIVAVFGVVVWNAYRDGVRPEDSLTTPQLADAGPFKSKPAEGTESKFVRPDYSATVFEQVEKPKTTVQPAPEVRAEPTPPSAKVTPPAAAKPAPPPAAAPPKPAAPVQSAPAPVTAPPKSAALVQTAAPPAKPAATPAPPPVQTAVATSAPAPAAPALAGAYAPAFASSGKFAVQVAAASDEAGAKAEWDRRAKSAPELFSTAERFIVQADVNGRTVYRVRAGSFATTADADAFCNAYKAKGGQCFRVTK